LGSRVFLGPANRKKDPEGACPVGDAGVEISNIEGVGGGLSFPEKIACIGIKELLRRSTIFHQERQFRAWVEFESEMIANHSHISVQTDWSEAQVPSNKFQSRHLSERLYVAGDIPQLQRMA